MAGRSNIIVRVSQACILLLAACLLWHWYRVRPPVIMSDDAVDDLIEEVGDTYVPVHVGEIQRGVLRKYVAAYGTIAPMAAMNGNGAASAIISNPFSASVSSVNCFEGQAVKQGAILFTLDPRFALWPIWQAMSPLQNSPDTLTVIAPIGGTVTSVNIAMGETVQPGKSAVEIVDLDRLVATVDVPAASLAEVHIGQSASIDSLAGKVVLVDAAINPATGMGSADIALPAGSGLRLGQFISAQIVVGEEADRLYVPSQSITQDQSDESAVGRVETDGRWAVLVPVKTGWRDGDNVEVAGDGLAAGQQIVTGGASGLVRRTRLFLLKD